MEQTDIIFTTTEAYDASIEGFLIKGKEWLDFAEKQMAVMNGRVLIRDARNNTHVYESCDGLLFIPGTIFRYDASNYTIVAKEINGNEIIGLSEEEYTALPDNRAIKSLINLLQRNDEFYVLSDGAALTLYRNDDGTVTLECDEFGGSPNSVTVYADICDDVPQSDQVWIEGCYQQAVVDEVRTLKNTLMVSPSVLADAIEAVYDFKNMKDVTAALKGAIEYGYEDAATCPFEGSYASGRMLFQLRNKKS